MNRTKLSGLSLMLGLSLIGASCVPQRENPVIEAVEAPKPKIATVTLRVTERESFQDRPGFWRIVEYCGMPSKDVFSIAEIDRDSHRAYAVNSFYPTNSKTINFHGKKLDILSVDPEKIILSYQEE